MLALNVVFNLTQAAYGITRTWYRTVYPCLGMVAAYAVMPMPAKCCKMTTPWPLQRVRCWRLIKPPGLTMVVKT